MLLGFSNVYEMGLWSINLVLKFGNVEGTTLKYIGKEYIQMCLHNKL